MKKSFAFALISGIALAISAPLSASAHVPVSPNSVPAGTELATLTFMVPNESATASTTKVEVDLPKDTPFGSVAYENVSGWKASVVTEKLSKPVKTDDATYTQAPVSVTWTATGSGIEPGQFQRFAITVNPVPDTGKVMMPVHQSYSDGSVVNWVDPTPASGEEPEHPAPTLYINDPVPGDAPQAATSPSVTASGASQSSNSGVDVLGSVAVGISVVALVLALTNLLMGLSRRRSEK
ncbi:MAG: hypothetical protein RJA35_63 [Actinomycetota bacterium]